MRENRPSGSEGGAGANPLFLPLSNPKCQNENCCQSSLGFVIRRDLLQPLNPGAVPPVVQPTRTLCARRQMAFVAQFVA